MTAPSPEEKRPKHEATSALAGMRLTELLDGVSVNLVPVLLGDGIPLFAGISEQPVRLDGPRIVPGNGVTHLLYGVPKS